MKTGKRVLSIFMVALMLLFAAPLAGFVGLEIAPKAQAYSVGDYIQFGTYPQSRVEETTALKKAANAANWKSYGYYMGTGYYDARMVPSDYMKFADFFVDNVKYRALRIDKYRPFHTQGIPQTVSGNSSQYDNGYYCNTTYYFKYEPIIWQVGTPSGFIQCIDIIDSQAFQNFIFQKDEEFFQDVNCTSYANDYSTSSIRQWLNYDFFETAFTDEQKANIKSTELTIYAGEYGNYGSNIINDKVFIGSNQTSPYSYASEISSTTPKEGTDYAKSQGLYHEGGNSVYSKYSYWRTRYPGSSSLRSVSYNIYGNAVYDFVNYTDRGICPSCNLKEIKNDATVSISLFSELADTFTGEIHATTFNPQSTTGIYQFSGILEDYATTVVLNSSDIYIDNITIDGKKYNIKKDVLSTGKAEQLKGKSIICNYDKNAEEIIAISKCREFSDLNQTDISNINKEKRISVIIANEYKWLNGKVYVAGGTKEAGAIPFKIEIGNSLPSNYFDLSDSCKKNSAFDITISDVKLTGLENCGQILLNDNSFPKKVKLGESLYLEGSIYFPSDFWLGYEDSEKTITAEYEIQLNSGKDEKVFQTVVKNRDPKPVTQNESDLLTDAVNKLKKTSSNAISLAGLAELGFSRAQIQYLEKAVLVELSLYTMPAESLEEYVSKKVIEKIFSVKNLLGVQDGKMTIVVPYQNGTKQVDIVCDIQGYTLTGRSFGNFTTLSYHAYNIKNGKREKFAFKEDGIAGLAVSANLEAFAEAATDLALGEIKSASKKVLNGYEEVEQIIFGDTALKILSAAGYNSNFDFGWDLYVNQCKAIGLACPVDVYVYDKNDTLCGAIVNNEVTLDISDDVDLEVLNDEKLITLWEDGYYVKTLANCEGNLNITIKEMGYINGAIRTMTFENLPLSVGTLYRQDYGTDYYDDQSVFAVEELNGDRIEATSDTLNLITESIYDSHTHTYTAAITTAPTCTTDGETTFTCSVCGDTYTEPIPATGDHVDKNNDGKCDTCGEKMTGGKHCKYCGKIHGGAFGWLVKFFHSIFAIFKR